MNIKKLELMTIDLGSQNDFYENILELPVKLFSSNLEVKRCALSFNSRRGSNVMTKPGKWPESNLVRSSTFASCLMGTGMFGEKDAGQKRLVTRAVTQILQSRLLRNALK